ncbi:hypothetical protein [Bythopirellula polymerisocia]|uniref:Uncharacterized protein n=1 Tax=Bythopirellula polymerisocia TaxID=2528003 RepID=A0A5C6CI31_9BACT|nr:hypothetical protein [Bythopirellula polymerisocia]TWU23735.1 hypothetical protein Pla144_39100 [Bythopirellula polymerisocia]
MKTKSLLAVSLLIIPMAACDVPDIETGPVASTPAPKSTTAGEPAGQGDGELFGKEDWYLPDGRIDMSGVEGEPPMTTGVPREVKPKDPKQGKLSRRSGGALGTNMQAIPWVKNETTFNLVIKPALMQYEIIHSQYPKNHQEFMEKFIPEMCPQVLPLPELEPGDEYLYDPEDNLLKIWRPAEATPELRAKYLGEKADSDSAGVPADAAAESVADATATPVDPSESTESENVSIRGRAEALNRTRQAPIE